MNELASESWVLANIFISIFFPTAVIGRLFYGSSWKNSDKIICYVLYFHALLMLGVFFMIIYRIFVDKSSLSIFML